MNTPEPIPPLTETYGAIPPHERPVLFWRGASESNEGLLLSGIVVSPAERADAHPPATVPDEGLRESLRLAFEKAELDWPSRPDLAYAGLRTFIRAVLSSTDDEVGEPSGCALCDDAVPHDHHADCWCGEEHP